MYQEGKIKQQPRYSSVERKSRHQQLTVQSYFTKRTLKLSLLILLLSVLVWGWLKLTNPQTFPITAVQIKGSYAHVDHENLRQTVLPFIQRGFINLDSAGLQDKLLQLPWIAMASVTRIWPNKIQITLAEQHPVAFFGDDALVNAQGQVFNVAGAKDITNLPHFIGGLGQQKLMLQAYAEMLQSLAPLGQTITTLVLDNQHFWRLKLDNGIVLLLGQIQTVERLKRFVKVYTQVVGDKASVINYIDLRYTHGVAVRFKS